MKHFFRGRKKGQEAPATPAAGENGEIPSRAQKRTVLSALAPALAASTGVSTRASSHAIPDFGFASIQNSTGASAAVAELSKHFDILLTDWNSTDDFGARRRQLEKKLRKQAEQYANSRLNTQRDAAPWKHTADDLAILAAAIKCSVSTYDPNARVTDSELAFETVRAVPASMNGIIKATTFTRVTTASSDQPTARRSFPALVVAVRGSFKFIDWVVNGNHETRDAKELLAAAEWLPEKRSQEAIKVHSGFLNAAKALLPVVKDQLRQAADSGNARHIIFTGHSAGGAVASLLYLHFLGIASTTFPSLRFSLVTFGSPPVTDPSVTAVVNEHLIQRGDTGLAISVVNETDVVPRADEQYILSLVNLYRTIDGLAPIAEAKPPSPQPGSESDVPEARAWPLPAPVLHPVGNVVVLKELDEESDDPQIGAFSVSGPAFARLLYCGTSAHHKEVYAQAVQRLREEEQVSS